MYVKVVQVLKNNFKITYIMLEKILTNQNLIAIFYFKELGRKVTDNTARNQFCFYRKAGFINAATLAAAKAKMVDIILAECLTFKNK